ncbi:MAG: LptF/LptG family permease [Thermodesulfovibrio sp.]|uniref:LptF/LptG family permease n=1 Tax=unclassified Thermodesulfovibrio TaxID=2645936 RepID=UPI00083A5F09|nr:MULTISPECIES: LptF/LptG family permease [unclassified Thermodesulfovibrio]MDI1471068.1 LptF/LptG family permease [Thermodesulfovibrio sp. 1176]MDI6713918.1 LptF/LptG family permease [Thermodesulfovibrio sp.]ODA43691.1 permease YjgP/YjgQ family protein [Thermodesulfovibrio sp. N1]
MRINIVCFSYLKDFLKIFIVLTISLASLLSIIGIVEKIDDFMPYKPSLLFFIEYFLYNIPRYVFYLIPFVTLISSLFIFSIGIRTRELLILSVSGGRLRKILKPFLFLGVIISLFGFIFGEFIQPYVTKKINVMIETLTEKNKSRVQKDVYVRTKDGIVVKIGTLNFSEQSQNIKIANNLKIFIIKDDILLKRIDSEKADITNKEWLLKNVIVYDFINGRVEKLPEMNYPMNLKLSVTAFKDIKKIEEFGISELLQKRRELKKVGLSNPKIDTDISGRLSYNFVTLFMMILGLSLPLGAYEKFSSIFSKTKSGVQASGLITVSIGLLITIVYWLFYSLFMFVGYSKILPPFIAPWITTVVFGLVSVKLYFSIKE